MTLLQMRHELRSRLDGFIEDARLTRLLNEAYHEVMEQYEWPFLTITGSGAAPLTVGTLRRVIYVVDTVTGTRLHFQPIQSVIEDDPELDDTEDPSFYWVDNATIKTSPATTHALSVRYIKTATDLAGDADDPQTLDGFPSRYHNIIVDVAQLHAITQGPNSRQPARVDQAAALSQLVTTRIEQMADVLLGRQERQEFIVPWGGDMTADEFAYWENF